VNETSSVRPKPPANPPFVHRALGQAQIVAVAAENPFPGTDYQWSWIFNALPSRNWLWYQRHGVSYQANNDHFWSFLIPGIGSAPVLTFLALISVFAVVVGPLNYYLLHRRKRLYLLPVTVPLGAMLVTAGLFLYATLADGLGVRARVRSLTEIDQHRQQAVSWSRQSYYAGLAPSQGLVYSAEAAVYPIDYRPVSRFGVENASREMIWGEQQHLARGYFPSRTVSQMLVVEPRTTNVGLRVEDSGGDGPPRVTNELGVAVTRMLLCDGRGKHYTANQVASGAVATLAEASLKDESAEWRAILGQHRPTYPEGFNPAQLENVTDIFGNPFRFQSGMPEPSMDVNLMEVSIRRALGSDFQWMQPGTYVVMTSRPPYVSLGVTAAEEVGGFHLILGKW
jgi:hypothetical protein